MTQATLIQQLELIMEVPEGTLTSTSELAEYAGWSSMAQINLVAYLDKTYQISLDFSTLDTFVTVEDILRFVEKEQST